MKRPIAYLLSILLLFCFAACGTTGPGEPAESEVLTDSAASAGTNPVDIYLPKPPDKRLAVSAKQNKDAMAWLTIEGTTIDDAVFQSADNEYYLRRDAYGEYSLEGCYFADFECGLDDSIKLSRNTVVYGHTFQGDKDMRFFAQLYKYVEDEEWALAHRYIQFSVSDAMLTFEVISAGEVDSADTLPITAGLNIDELDEVAQAAIERSVFDFGADSATCNRLLTLSTCTGDYSTRLLIVAKLVSQ